MQELIEAGLSGRGLMRLSTQPLVDRYNDALAALGLPPTKLSAFFIDGMGWSPEVAQEQGNIHYLLDGSAHQFAIIISPDQRKKPIYIPYTSFERQLMAAYFAAYETQIADITSTHSIVLDIDAEVLRYQSPRDLLLVDEVIVRSRAGTLLEGAATQKALVRRLIDEPDAWVDPVCRTALSENAAEYGDLRKRRLGIDDFRFDDLASFYTEAFGGVFVFRRKRDRMLVLCDEKAIEGLSGTPGTELKTLLSPELPMILRNKGLATIDLELRDRQVTALEDIGNCLVANYVFLVDPECNWAKLTDMHRRRLVGRLPPEQTELLRELEFLRRSLSSSHLDAPSVDGLSPALQLLLLTPSKGLAAPARETVALLLARIRTHDPLELYAADKNRFFIQYATWPQGKKLWAIERIKKRYKAVMDS